MSKNKMYSNSTNLGIYCYLGATFFGYFLPNFSIYSFSSSATACHLYRYIYCRVIFSESQIWQGERWGQQAFRIGCQRCNVEYANEPQMLYIYIYDLCKVLFQEKCLLHFCAHYFLLFLLVKCYHFHRSETSWSETVEIKGV